MHLSPPDTSIQWILWIWLSKMAAAAILKNQKILISSQPIDRFWWNLACWCHSTLSTTTANKIWRFQKSKITAAAILKIRKLAISLLWMNKFWDNLARWCVSNLLISFRPIFQQILVCWCIIVLPCLSAIKCTVIDNKTANINDLLC